LQPPAQDVREGLSARISPGSDGALDALRQKLFESGEQNSLHMNRQRQQTIEEGNWGAGRL
jgi:hypothetical protein